MKRFLTTLAAASALTACASPTALSASTPAACTVELVVLGVGQDAGIPQIGQHDDPSWDDPWAGRYATSLAVIDHRSGARFLFEATPDLRAQMHRLDEIAAPVSGPLGLSGAFLTHAHIGHYAGLMSAA
jgi:pyrroloquinoline quinone biosynthesis protein B